MTSNTLRLGRFFGIELKLDYSWFIIFVLITWSLASYYFPAAHPGGSQLLYWAVAAVTSVLFFASVVGHELAHSLVARAQGTPVRDITLFIFGGAASISAEPRRPRDELFMALAGPAASLAAAAVFAALWWLSRGLAGPVHALALWLAVINTTLALFNLIPGLPLDGGRALRAIAWRISGNPQRATRIAARAGQLVAYGFIVWGLWQVFAGNWADGLWMAFIGWFLDGAASRSYRETALQELLAGHKVREAMVTDCPQVPRQLALDVVVEQVVLPSGRTCFPVTEGGEVRGLLTLAGIKAVSRGRWPTTRVADVMIPLADLPTVGPDEDLAAVFDRLGAAGDEPLPVLADGRVLGLVTQAGLLGFIERRTALGLGKGAA